MQELMNFVHQLLEPINLVIFIGMLVVIGLLLYFRSKTTENFLKSVEVIVGNIDKLEGSPSDKQLVEQINEIMIENSYLQNEYKHFQNSQIEVEEQDTKKIYATHKIEDYLTVDKIFKMSRSLDDGGGYLTGIGLLITFIMIALGLSNLNINDTQALQSGIGDLISSLSGKFIGSIMGIGCALFYNYSKDQSLTKIDKQITSLNGLINQKIANKYSENVIHDIDISIKQQTEDLKEFFSGNAFSNAILEAFDKRQEQSATVGLLGEIKLAIERQNGSELASNISGLVQSLSSTVGDISGKQVTEMNKQLDSFQASMQNTQEDMKTALNTVTKEMLMHLSDSSDARRKSYDEENNKMLMKLKENVEHVYTDLQNKTHQINLDFANKQEVIESQSQANYDALIKNQDAVLNNFNQQAKAGLEIIQSNFTKYGDLFHQLENLLSDYKHSVALGKTVIDNTNSTLSSFNQSAAQLSSIHSNLSSLSSSIKPLAESLVGANSGVLNSLDILANKETIVNDGLNQLMQSFVVQMQTWQEHIGNTQIAMNDTNEVIKLLDNSVTSYTTEYQSNVTGFIKDFTGKLDSIIGNIQSATQAIGEFTEELNNVELKR